MGQDNLFVAFLELSDYCMKAAAKMAASHGAFRRYELLPFRRITATAAPLYATMLASSVESLVDTALLGRHATSSLAGFALTIAVYSPAVATVTGALRGVMPFVGQCKDNPRALGRLVRNGMWLGFAVGVLGGVAVGCAGLIGRATSVPESTLSHLGVFPFLLALAVVSSSVGSSAASLLVSLGAARKVLRAGIVATVVGVILSVTLIDGPGPLPSLGLTGAGIAMLAASLVSTVRMQGALHRLPALKGVDLRPGRPDVKEMTRIARVGFPLAGTVLIKFVVLGVLTFAAARLGTLQGAAHGFSESMVNLIYTLAVAIGQATIPVVSSAVDDGDISAARRGVVAGAGVALCGVGSLGAALMLFGSRIVPLFSSSPALQALMVHQLPLVFAVVVTDSLQSVAGFGMAGLRNTVPSLISTAIFFGVLCLVAVPVADAGGLVGLWTALICANSLQAVSKGLLFRWQSARMMRLAPAN
jgi:MATE family multidrug resistance protein